MASVIKVLGISGSLRKGSYNTRLLEIAKEHLPDGMTLEIAGIGDLPLYNDDLIVNGEFPAVVEAFKAKIRAADALLMAVPEYNYSVSGVLKNAIDWASRPPATTPLNRKPLAMMGVGGRFGTTRAQLHLRQIAVFTNMLPLNKPEVLISNFPNRAFDDNGNLVDEMSVKFLSELLVALKDWTIQLNPALA